MPRETVTVTMLDTPLSMSSQRAYELTTPQPGALSRVRVLRLCARQAN